MVHVVEGKGGNLRVWSLVFGMAALALRRYRQEAVQAYGLSALFGHVDVAALAAIVDDAMNWAMTMGTLLLEIGVRIVAAQHGSGGMHGG